jgi:hypothetical protein
MRVLRKKEFAPRIRFRALSLISSSGSVAGQSSGALGPVAFNFSKRSMNNLLRLFAWFTWCSGGLLNTPIACALNSILPESGLQPR